MGSKKPGYVAEIILAIKKLKQPNGSRLNSIVDYIQHNFVKNNNKQYSRSLNTQIRRDLSTALDTGLVRRDNGKYLLAKGIRNARGVGRSRRRSRRSRSRSRSRRSRSRSGSSRRRRRRRGSHRRSHGRSRSLTGEGNPLSGQQNDMENNPTEPHDADDCVEHENCGDLNCVCNVDNQRNDVMD